MYVVSVSIWVKPDKIEDFIEATLENARHTRREPGNLRFDVSRCVDDPDRFLLYEVYREENDFHSHHETKHYGVWRDAVADWMARDRQGIKHESIFPDGPRNWSSEGGG